MQKISFKNFVNHKDPDLIRKIEDEAVLNEFIGNLLSAGAKAVKSVAGTVGDVAKGLFTPQTNQQQNQPTNLGIQGRIPFYGAKKKKSKTPAVQIDQATAQKIQQEIAKIDKRNRTFNAMKTLFPNEVADVQEVQKRDVVGQAELDKELHDNVQGTNRFSDEAKAFLDEDKKLKTAFQEIMKGSLTTQNNKQISSAYIQKIISGLESDKYTHKYYLGQPQDQNTGSYGWQNHWISVYDGWIAKLKQVKQILSKYKL